MCELCGRPLGDGGERRAYDGICLPCLLPADECHACGASAYDVALRYDGETTGGNTAVCAAGCGG